MKNGFEVRFILESHLWFLYALGIIQVACLPFHVIARTLIHLDNHKILQIKGGNDESRKCANEELKSNSRDLNHIKLCGLKAEKFIPIVILCNIVFNAAFIIFMETFFDVTKHGKTIWLVALPFASTIPLLCVLAGAKLRFRNHKIIGVVKLNIIADSLQIFGFLLIPLSMFIFLGSSSICPRPDCDRLAYISINLVFTMNLIILCNMTGMMFGEIQDRMHRVIAYNKKKCTQFLPVMVLLLSWGWPFFTYWGPMYMRRSAFVTTYQESSIIKLPIVMIHLSKNENSKLFDSENSFYNDEIFLSFKQSIDYYVSK